MTEQVGPGRAAPALDEVIGDLQRRRAEAGNPPYAEIAGRIEAARLARGVGAFEARISRSTVYDMFRLGRRRIDVELLAELVTALGAEPDEVVRWRARAAEALTPPATRSPGAAVPASPVELPRLGGTGTRADTRLRPLSRRAALLVLLGCWLLNVGGALLTKALPIELYLDMVGTAIAALLVGPWAAAAVGVATNLGEVWTLETWQALWFGLANGAGALVWGYGVRRGMGRTILRYVVLNVAVAFAVTAVATNVLLFAFHGYTGHATDSLVHSLADRGHSLLVSIFSTNLLTSLQDKLLSGFLALIVAEYVAQRQSGEATRLPLGE